MNSAEARLTAAIEAARGAAARLQRSLTLDRALILAATEGDVSEAPERATDAFVQRYEQLVEHLTRRVYPAIYRIEEGGERPPPLATLLAYLEGAGIIESERAWGDRLDIRNRLVHEYPLDAEERSGALSCALAGGADLLDDLERALGYVEARRLLEATRDH